MTRFWVTRSGLPMSLMAAPPNGRLGSGPTAAYLTFCSQAIEVILHAIFGNISQTLQRFP